MTSADLAAHKEQIVDACKALIETQVMSISEHGNVSARVRGTDTFLLTAGGSLANMTAENIALFNLDGTLLDGAVEPTSAEIVDITASSTGSAPKWVARCTPTRHTPRALPWPGNLSR